MNNIPVFDLHCDTIYECLTKNCNFTDNNLHIDYNKTKNIGPYIQCFAICVPEEIRGKSATQMFCEAYKALKKQCDLNNITLIKNKKDITDIVNKQGRGAVFTVENASVLAGDIKNISLFKEFNVKIVTLTWNGKNELGAGSSVTHSNGLTRFGKEVVKELIENNIAIDMSHTSDRLFYDIVNETDKPVIATHSNSRVITNVKRNLTDKQFEIISNRKGIVGLNFHKYFLSNNPDEATKYDILKHTEHFLSLGGENVVALGCDFDGCELPKDINGVESLNDIYEMFLKKNYNETLLRKIFFENAFNFWENFDK